LKAGSGTFSLNAAATNGYNGTALVNPALAQSAQANTGIISTTASQMTVAGPLRYSEVGYFRLQPFGVYDDGSFADVDAAKPVPECIEDGNLGTPTAPADPNVLDVSGKLGCYFGNTLTPYFGRFIPDHFGLSAASIVNRSAIPACSASTFSYVGEQLTSTFTLTAQNADDETTVNYTGAFARLNVSTGLGLAAISDPAAPAVRLPFPVCGATPAHPCYTPGAVSGSFMDGEAVAIKTPLTVWRSPSRVGPFEQFKIGIAPLDLDNVRILNYDLDGTNVTPAVPNRTLVASTPLRYGRLNIDNGYGSELLNLTLRASAQYWNGVGYVTNTADSCTPLAASDILLDTYVGGINAINMKATQVVSGGPLQLGVGKFQLSKPSPTPASRGSVVLKSQYPYLPGSGRATFGTYKAGPVIYLRESY
jgi:MSHA biogenesis protein MshQ